MVKLNETWAIDFEITYKGITSQKSISHDESLLYKHTKYEPPLADLCLRPQKHNKTCAAKMEKSVFAAQNS